MKASHKLSLALIFSIIYCCMVGSSPINSDPNEGSAWHNTEVNFHNPAPQSQDHLASLRNTFYNILHHHDFDSLTVAEPRCDGQFIYNGVHYPVHTFQEPVTFSDCKTFSDTVLRTPPTPNPLHDHGHPGPVTWTSTIVVSGFHSVGHCWSLEDNDLFLPANAAANTGMCAYIDLQPPAAGPGPSGFLPSLPAPVQPAPVSPSMQSDTHPKWRGTTKQRQEESLKLKLGLQNELNELHGGFLCDGTINYDGVVFVIRKDVKNCKYSQCQDLKNAGHMYAEHTDPAVRARRKTILVTGFAPNSGEFGCVVVGNGHVTDGMLGLGICAMIWVSRTQPQQSVKTSAMAIGYI